MIVHFPVSKEESVIATLYLVPNQHVTILSCHLVRVVRNVHLVRIHANKEDIITANQYHVHVHRVTTRSRHLAPVVQCVEMERIVHILV